MTLSSEIGQATFVEVIRVDLKVGQTCKSQITLGRSPWQNPRNRFDVNGDGVADEKDIIALNDFLAKNGAGKLPVVNNQSIFPDVDGDGYVSNHDVQQLSMFVYDHVTVDTESSTCYPVSDFKIERDLLDPSKVRTVKNVAAAKGILPTSDYVPYLNFYTSLMPVEYDREVQTKDSIVFIHRDVLTPKSPYLAGCSNTSRALSRLLRRLQKSPYPCTYDPRHPLPTPPTPTATTTVTTSSPDDPIVPNPPILTTAAPTTAAPTTAAPPSVPTGTQHVLVICIFDQSTPYGQTAFDQPRGGWHAMGGWGLDRYYWEDLIKNYTSSSNFDVRLIPIWIDRAGDCSTTYICEDGINPLRYMYPGQVPPRPGHSLACSVPETQWMCLPFDTSRNPVPFYTIPNQVDEAQLMNIINLETKDWYPTKVIWVLDTVGMVPGVTGYSWYDSSYHDTWTSVTMNLNARFSASVCDVNTSYWPECQSQWNYYTPSGVHSDESRWLCMATDALHSLINLHKVTLPGVEQRTTEWLYDTLIAELEKQSIDYFEAFNVYIEGIFAYVIYSDSLSRARQQAIDQCLNDRHNLENPNLFSYCADSIRVQGPIKSSTVILDVPNYSDWGFILNPMYVSYRDSGGPIDEIRPGAYPPPYSTWGDPNPYNERGGRRIYYGEPDWPAKAIAELRRLMPI